MGQKTVLKCSQQSTDPWGLQQAVSFAWPLLCQARMGMGLNRAETQKIDLAVGVTAFSADNITTRRVCWGGSWALIPHGRENVTWMQLAKKKKPWESTVTRQVTGMNTFVTKKLQLFLHSWDLCLLPLQAMEWSFTFWYSSRVHYSDMTETREMIAWIWLTLMY